MSRLVLIDGNAILHRAYHALPPLTTPKGKPINAVYGFTTMLVRLMNDLQPTHIAVCFDRPKPTFRKELYEGYQAKRPKMDDDLSSQIPIVHELLASFHIPIFEQDGFEADDVIGTICKKIRNHPPAGGSKVKIDQVIIVTGDRDILQLVEDDRVLVYMPVKGLSEGKLFGEKETKERMGVLPKQIPDFKALAGDPSDNYPGVTGIGTKTAIMLLDKTKTIDNLYKKLSVNADLGLSENIINKLKENKEDALMSHNLATIKQDVPMEISLSPIRNGISDESIQFLQSLGFQSLIKRLMLQKSVKASKHQAPQEEKKQADQLSFI